MEDPYKYGWCLECGTRVVRIRNVDSGKVVEVIHTDPTSDPARSCCLNRNTLTWLPAGKPRDDMAPTTRHRP